MNEHPADRRLWTWVVVLGLTGQLAWTVENMYLNVFVYDTITDSPMALATLVAASALAATVATLLAGAASDRSGRRRELIAGGYVLWGACTAAFGLVSVDAAAALLPMVDAVTVAIAVIILLDCVMSVLGAAANDAAFNAWVTDSTHPGNRGRVDGVLATMPLLAM
ncbi:MFS transporter, partial [Mumia sp.]